MSRTTARRAFMVATPLAFAGLLTQHPTGGGDFYTGVSENVTAWLAVHYGAAVLFPLMAFVVWLLIRDLRGRAATVARVALPVFAVFYGVWEAMFGIANGLLAKSGNQLDGEAREGVRQAVADIVASPWFGEMSVFNTIGGMAWVTGVIAAILALRHAGVARTPLVLLGVGSLMIMHIPPIGPVTLICLSAGAFLVDRQRSAVLAPRPRLVPA
jgi:hypothetical protein